MSDENQIMKHARAMYGDHAEAWMNQRLNTLNGKSPREVPVEPYGAGRIQELLTQIDEGMFI